MFNFAFATLVAIIIQGNSCVGNRDYGPLEKETRKVSGFNAIEVSHGIDVYLTMGSREFLEVETPEDLLEHLVTEVKGGKLKIYFDRSFNWNNETKVYIQAKNIESINTSGGSDVFGENKLETKDLELKASGGSDIKLEVDTKSLDVNVSGGADIELSGQTVHLYANSSGGSDLKAFELITQRANLEASGGSDIKVYVEEELDAKASGGADIEYMGTPRLINSNSSSSGDIKKKK